MLRKTFLSSSLPPASLSRHLTYSISGKICARTVSSEAYSLRPLHKPESSGFFEPNTSPHSSFTTLKNPAPHNDVFSRGPFPNTSSHQLTPQAIARQAAQAIRTCILQNNDQRNAYAILNSLYQHSASCNNPIPTRLATSALIHSLIRVGSPFRAAQIAETAWIGSQTHPIDYSNSMRLHWRTSDSIVTALTAHHLLPSSQPPPLPPPKSDLAHAQYLEKRAGIGEGTMNLSKTRLDYSSQRALLFLRVARNARQKRQQAMYSKIIEVCLLQGEIIIATLLFVLLVRDYQVRKMIKAAKEEYVDNKEVMFTAEASVEDWPKLTTDASKLSRSLIERRPIGWLSTISPDLLARLESLKNVDIEKAIQLGLDQSEEVGNVLSDHPASPSGQYLKLIGGALNLRSGAGQLQSSGACNATSGNATDPGPGLGNDMFSTRSDQRLQSIWALSELAQLTNDLCLEEYGSLPERLARYQASRIPAHLQPRVAPKPRLLESYALKEIPGAGLAAKQTEKGAEQDQVPLSTLCHSALVNLSRRFMSSQEFKLPASSQHALIQYAYFCNNIRLAAKLVKSIQERGQRIPVNTYSVIITGLVKCGRFDAAREVIEMVRSAENLEVTPMARVLLDTIVGDIDAPNAQQKDEGGRTLSKKGKKSKDNDDQKLSLRSTSNTASAEQLKYGHPLNKQDNLSIALIYYAATVSSQSDLIPKVLPIILPHAFDESLLFPSSTSSTSEAQSLDLVASYGPRFYIELMNALRKHGHTGYVERVWNVAAQASKHSWRVYVKRKMREVMKVAIASGGVADKEVTGGLNVSLDYAASPVGLPGSGVNAAMRKRQMTMGPNGWEARMWDDMPWLVDIGAWTMLMKVYGMERKKGLDIINSLANPPPDASSDDSFEQGDPIDNPNIYARGWGGCRAKFRMTLPRDQLRYIHEAPPPTTTQPRRRCDVALECAWMLHTALTSLRDDMFQFMDDVWAEREARHRLYDPSNSSKTIEGAEERKSRDLELLKQRIYQKLQRAIPVPDERYFNSALQVFGRGDGMRGRVNGMFGSSHPGKGDDHAIQFLQERYVQLNTNNKVNDCANRRMNHEALQHLRKDMEKFGYELPQVYRLAESNKRDSHQRIRHLIPVASKRRVRRVGQAGRSQP